MQCLRPIRVGYDAQGDLTYKQARVHPEIEPWAFNCRKCLPCRLNIAREKAIRCYHESKMHDYGTKNIFLTLTYRPEDLESPWLNYGHFQTFIKDLRDRQGYEPENRISYMVTGEYGEENKRPHWHAILFNYRPQDQPQKPLRKTERGELVFRSPLLEQIWARGNTEYGSVTPESAGYVARYAAKKLVHGSDGSHPFQPLHRTSSKRAIGRSWLEKHWQLTFAQGYVSIPSGDRMVEEKIPRYYVDWCKKYKPETYYHYVTKVLPVFALKAEAQQRKEEIEFFAEVNNRSYGAPYPLTRARVKQTILESKFKQLQERLKL